MKKSILLGILLFIVIIFLSYIFLSPTKIIAVYKEVDDLEGRAVVVIKNPPFTNQGLLDFWDENKRFLIDHYQLEPSEEFRSIILVKLGYEKNEHTEMQQFCFSNVLKGENNCINRNNTLLIIRYNDDIIDYYFSESNCTISEDRTHNRTPFNCSTKIIY